MAAPTTPDPRWMLFIAHFVQCELIYQHYLLAKAQFLNPITQSQAARTFIAYTHIWMALLYVVAEGFKELNLKDSHIISIIDVHLDDLRVFRNSVFHFQKDDRKRDQFHDANKFNWAQELHIALQSYFRPLEQSGLAGLAGLKL
jgi:hypothetical protein